VTQPSNIDIAAPSDYSEMHRHWYPFIVNLVASHGIVVNNKEDVAQDIFLRLMEWDILGEFNPELVFERPNGPRRARFKTFLSSVVRTYVRGHQDKQTRLHKREMQLHDGDISEYADRSSHGKNDNAAIRYIPPEPDHSDFVIENLVEEQIASNVRKLLAKIPKRNNTDTCDLPALFDAVRAQIAEHGCYDIPKLKDTFGVGSTTMYTWMWWLKANLADIYGVPLPARRPRTPRPKAV
jgi:DNA-directed RNA polymerase specialized sigma24 family protein